MVFKTKVACIYRIKCLSSGDCYVGSTSNKDERWAAHRRLLAKGKHHSPHLQNAWAKYGGEEFEFEVLEVCVSADLKKELKDREDYWMGVLSPSYNVLAASYSALGFKHPRESVERRAAMRRGVKRPAELVERIAAKHRGKKMPRDAVERTASSNRGRKMSEESIEKIRSSKRSSVMLK